MKKIIAFILVICMLFSVKAFADDQEIKIKVDGEILSTDVAPVIENGRVLVPMRAIVEALGAKVSWDGAAMTATIQTDSVTVKIAVDNADMIINNVSTKIDAPARLIDSRILIPVRAISEAVGADVNWDSSARMVTVTSAEPEIQGEQFDNLSQYDRNLLHSSILAIRSLFEVNVLAEQTIISGTKDFDTKFRKSSPEIIDFVKDLWNKHMIEIIKTIQEKSTKKYIMDKDLSEDEINERYMKLLDDENVDAESIFTVEFKNSDIRTPLLLLTYNDPSDITRFDDSYSGFSKEVALVIDRDGALRFFLGILLSDSEGDSGSPIVAGEIEPSGRKCLYSDLKGNKDEGLEFLANYIIQHNFELV